MKTGNVTFDGTLLRERLEEIKDRLGEATKDKSIHGMDRRIALSLREARPDFNFLTEETIVVFVRVTLDRLMQEALADAGLDPHIMDYEYAVEIDSEPVAIDGDSKYRVKPPRPNNKKELQAAISRQVSLALLRLFESRHIPPPVKYINRTVDTISKEITRIYLDSRITVANVTTVSIKRIGATK